MLEKYDDHEQGNHSRGTVEATKKLNERERRERKKERENFRAFYKLKN